MRCLEWSRLRSAALTRARVALLLAAALAAACGSPAAEPAAAGPRRGGTLVVATAEDLKGVNPLLADETQFAHDIFRQLFLSLLAEESDFREHPPTFSPALATSWSWSDDHRTLTLQLRADAVWSDGAPLTAEDVRFTWQAQTHPAVAWSYAASKERIQDVEVVGPHTVRVRFSEVYSGQLTDLNEGFVLPRHAFAPLPFAEWRRDSAWFLRHLVVSGPFALADWQLQQQLVLVRNDRYLDPQWPRLDRVIVRIIPDRTSQIAQLRAGRVDLVDALPPEDAARLAATAAVEILPYWARQYTYVGWNARRPLFADPAVRRALTLAIDREALVEALLSGRARVAVSPILTSAWAHDPDLTPWPYDPAAARRLLASRGWRDDDGDGVLDREGQPFRFEILTNGTSPLRTDAAVMIQSQLARVGVRAQPRPLDVNRLNERLAARDFEAAIAAWSIDTSLDLTYAFHSRSIDGGYNFVGYANPEVDRLIDEARRQADPAAARPLLHRIERTLHQDQPYTFLWEPQRLAALQRRVRGARPGPLGTLLGLESWWVEGPGRIPEGGP